MKKIKLVGFLILSFTLGVNAQDQFGFPLKVGNKMPEIVFHTVVNYPGNKAKLSDFLGKPVILDLWHVQCSSCIQGMPKMQALQRKFGDKIQIIGLGMNNISDYRKLKKHSTILKNITSLPLALQADSILFKNLVGVYPTHIWIDKQGIIREITRGENATEKHIQSFIDGENLNFIIPKPKNAPNRWYPIDSSLLIQANGRDFKRLKYHSLFTGRLDYNSFQKTNLGPINPGKIIINYSADRLLGMFGLHDESRPKLVFDTEDLKSRFLVPKSDDEYDEWYQKNTYSYELSLPEGKIYSDETIREYCKQDIQRFFGVKIEHKQKLTNCLVLYRLDNVDRIKTKGSSDSWEDFESNGYNKIILFTNLPMKIVLEQIESALSWRKEPVKIIDETKYTYNVDLKFNTKLDNVNLVKAGLEKYGLGLKEEQRVIDCIVISRAE